MGVSFLGVRVEDPLRAISAEFTRLLLDRANRLLCGNPVGELLYLGTRRQD